MKLFLFERIDQLTESYHPEGGLVIVANDEEHARALIADDEYIKPTELEWTLAYVYELAESELPPKVFTFPDAGCC